MEAMMTAVKRSTPRQSARNIGGASTTHRVLVENINHPGSRRSVDAAKYGAMSRAILKVLPARAPGLTLADALTAVLPHLPDALFPDGAQAGWWFKTVQLDLEARRKIVRERTSPLRVHRLGPSPR